MTRARDRGARGFSLVEMLVSLVISAIVIAGAIGLMVSTQRHFESTSADRYLQETARVALGHLTNNLRSAGFGVDPSLAFDFGAMTNVRMDRAYGGATFSTTSSCASLCRDSTSGPDEVVFFSRDPSFGPHPLTVAANAGSSALTVAGRVSVQKGQILQVVCYTGTMTWAYVQASGASSDNGNGTSNIPIASGTSVFPRQNGWLADACYGSVATMIGNVLDTGTLATAAEVFKVDRYHYYVASYDRAGTVQPWGSPNTRPYLMLEQGLQDASGTVVTPLVPDVEDLQLSYVFPTDAVTPLVGASVGTSISSDDAGINLAPASGGPVFSDASNAVTRLNHHPGNIGAVRVSIVVRSADADLRLQGNATVPAAGNRDVAAGAVGYLRLLVETTVAVPNLGMQAPYYPTYGITVPAVSGSRQLNVGGG